MSTSDDLDIESGEQTPSPEPVGPKRRPLEYRSLPAILEDAEQLAAGPHKVVGGLSYGQILQHLARTMVCAFDGFGEWKPNFLLRWILRTFFKKKFLTEIPPGYNMPVKIPKIHPDDDATTESGINELRAAVKRFEKETPLPVHPAFGKMTPDEWIALQLRHAELHMSYVWPD